MGEATTSLTFTAGQRTLSHRNSAGQLTGITNPNGQTYRFTYNAVDECIAQQGLDEQTQAYTLDVLGLPTEVREAAGTPHEILTELIRDAAGRLSDQLLRVVRSTKSGQPIDEISWDYDGQGRPRVDSVPSNCLLVPQRRTRSIGIPHHHASSFFSLSLCLYNPKGRLFYSCRCRPQQV